MKVIKVFLSEQSNSIHSCIEDVNKTFESFIKMNNQAFLLEDGNAYLPMPENFCFSEHPYLTMVYNDFFDNEIILMIDESKVKSAMSTEHVGYRASLIRVNKETSSSIMFSVIASIGTLKLDKNEEYTIRKIKRTKQDFYRIS